jgi:dTDP-4-dehydrorhamnose reductase
MKALITGMNGTVAPVLARRLESAGHSIVAWDRAAVSPEDPKACCDFVAKTGPDWVFHLAMGGPDWAESIARACAEREIRFLFTSTVSVYANTQRGPFPTSAKPEPNDDYGRYKMDCERRIAAANPNAQVARLGWQIGTKPGSNNMVDYLDKTNRERGRIEASAKWFPSCAFLEDTADALAELMESHPAGLYHLEGNPGLNFFEIATNVNRLQGNPWKVEPTGSHDQHNLMVGNVRVSPITRRFNRAS